MNKIFSRVKRCTQGDVKLWKVFWLLNLIPFVVLVTLSIILAHYLKLAGVDVKNIPRGLSYAIHTLSTCYFAWVAFCIWRCSDNVNWQGWGIIARLYEVIICYLYAGLILSFEISTVKSLLGPSFYTHAVSAILVVAQVVLLVCYIAGIFLKIKHSLTKAYQTIHRTILPWSVAIIHLSFISSTISSNMLLDHGYSDKQIAVQIFRDKTDMTQQQIDQILHSTQEKKSGNSQHSKKNIPAESILAYHPSAEKNQNTTIDN